MTTQPIPACMGGWCLQRTKCQHYAAPQRHWVKPAERLCGTEERPLLFIETKESASEPRAD